MEIASRKQTETGLKKTITILFGAFLPKALTSYHFTTFILYKGSDK